MSGGQPRTLSGLTWNWTRCFVRSRPAAFNARVFVQEVRFAQRSGYSLTVRNRSALAITETELKLIAAPAIIGLRRTPKNG